MEIVAPPHLPEVSPPDLGPRPLAGHEMAVGRDTRRQLQLEGAAQGPAIRTRFAPLDGQARVLGEEVPIGAANRYRRLVCHLAPGPGPRWAPRRRRVPRRPAGPLSSAPGALEVLEQLVREQAEQVPRIPMSSPTKTIREKDGGRRAEQLKCDAGALAYRTSHVIHGIGRPTRASPTRATARTSRVSARGWSRRPVQAEILSMAAVGTRPRLGSADRRSL
jgi:hypothetical protein